MFSNRQEKELKATVKDLYRNIHPDILQNAPERVRNENQRSLTILNNYITNMDNNGGNQYVKLKFYTPEKTTRKNKKYFYFELNLH